MSLLVAIVALAVPDKRAKIILLAVLLIGGAVIALLLFRQKKPKAPAPKKHFTAEDVAPLLEQYGTDDAPAPRVAKLVQTKSKTDLYRHGKVVCGDRTVFDITVCRSKNYQGKRYYRISSELYEAEKEYFIKDDPDDRAVYLYSLNPELRALTDEVETNPPDDVFHPWKEFESLEDYVGNSIPGK